MVNPWVEHVKDYAKKKHKLEVIFPDKDWLKASNHLTHKYIIKVEI